MMKLLIKIVAFAAIVVQSTAKMTKLSFDEVCPEEARVACGNGAKDKRFHVCHHNNGKKEYQTLCLSESGAEGHFSQHVEDYCGMCLPDDPFNQDLGSPTYPYVQLLDPLSRYTFNSITTPLCIVVENGELDISTISLTVNEVRITPIINDNATMACADDTFVFDNGENQILFSAMTTEMVLGGEDVPMGSLPLELSTSIQAGSETISLVLVDEAGGPFIPETEVTATLSDDTLVTSKQSATSSITFTNLPPRTITFTALGPNGEFGSAGAVASMVDVATLVMFTFDEVSTVENLDFSLGTTEGWKVSSSASVTIVDHEEDVGPGRRLQLEDKDLKLDTAGIEGEQRAKHTFSASTKACGVRVRYRFVTSEIPGGFFGTEFNDYYSVSIRAKDSEKSIVDSNTMNGLGEAAFDPVSGSTKWFESVLKLDDGWFNGDKVQVDLVVANVGDNLYDSQLYVDFVEEIVDDDDTDDDECACAACQDWFDKEIKDIAWINKLPRCPCSVVRGLIPGTVRPKGSDISDGTLNGVNWDTDKSCNLVSIANRVLCNIYHPGAVACIRAAGPGGTGQQCCYNSDFDILLHGHAGAGTPDRFTDFDAHQEGDVETYSDCCKKCPSLCANYIGKKDGTQGARSDPRSNIALCPNGKQRRR